MRKEEVYKFSNKVKLLLKSLEGVEITGQEYKLNQIKKLYAELEKIIDKFSPTIQEEFSYKTRVSYNNMIKAKNYYSYLKKTNCTKEEIKSALDNYTIASTEYENSKKIRDSIKNIEKCEEENIINE